MNVKDLGLEELAMQDSVEVNGGIITYPSPVVFLLIGIVGRY